MTDVPNEEDWGDCSRNFDRKSAFNSFFGKTNEQMQAKFYSNGLELMTEIRFMPTKAFNYYILGFRDFILAKKFQEYEASDFASYFLNMIEHLVENEPEFVSSSMSELMPAIEYISKNQDEYEAPSDIYGDFESKSANIKRICEEKGIEI